MQLEAQDISVKLRVNRFDVDKVKEMMTNLTTQVESVNKVLDELEVVEPFMTEQQKSNFTLVESRSELLQQSAMALQRWPGRPHFTKRRRDLQILRAKGIRQRGLSK